MFDPGPCVYMEKIAGNSEIADVLSLDDPLTEVIERVAERKGKEVGDVTVIMLDRPRHEEKVAEIRELGARIRLITDGDVSAALFAVSADAGVDLLWGIGGTPEGVISAAAIKCIGGQLLGKLWPRDEDERQAAIDAGYDLAETLDVDRLVSGNDVFFAATGVTDGELLQGVRVQPRQGDHRVAGDALALGDRAHGLGAPRPGEAARGDRGPLRLRRRSWSRGRPGTSVGCWRERCATTASPSAAWSAIRRRPATWSGSAARSSAATCSSPRRSGRRSRGSNAAYYLVHSMGRGARGRVRRPRRRRRQQLRRRRGRGAGRPADLPRRPRASRAPSICAAATRRPRSCARRAFR